MKRTQQEIVRVRHVHNNRKMSEGWSLTQHASAEDKAKPNSSDMKTVSASPSLTNSPQHTIQDQPKKKRGHVTGT
ncbi:unnamed protein product [Pleuronectes platessa]|uniref:Uncharacterized protein n=1 Tax=Pleuronectes platessa TaxID=8262 RepID=A0A9N7U8R2_PLEPL|nr:unnamed protein product [Pleuronectes platessa]